MKNLRFGFAVFASVLAMPMFSHAGNSLYVGYNQTTEFVNFAGTGPAGIASDTLPGGQKFLSLRIQNFNGGRIPPNTPPYCVEVNTVQAGTVAMDTRIWMRNANGSLVSLADDEGSHKFARVRVFVDQLRYPPTPGAQSAIELLIAAKSTLDNTGNFHVVKTPDLTYEDCYYDNAPFVYVDQNGAQLFRTQ